MTELAPSYDPKSFESRLYAEWEAAGDFKPSGHGEPYTILLPPPNVTGTLHMGHAFQQTLMDALVRHARMLGKDVLWQVGSDHAGIATEMVVSRNLALAGRGETRDSLGREGFIARIWQWKAQSGDTIERQMRRLGASADWSRSTFTMDPGPSQAVAEAFVRWYEQGLIYRGQRLVNWDPVLQTAISDLEVENHEVPGHMWHFKYLLADGETYEYVERDADGNIVLRETRNYIAIATTRPETMLGDAAVAVHPSDPRYAPIVGKRCQIPVGPKALRRLIPIITDDYPDPDFGSGAVKITGAHDFNDYAVAKRNGIPLYVLMDDAARMRSDGLPYAESADVAGRIARGERSPADVREVNLVPEELRGLDRYEARRRVVAAITAEGLAVTDAAGNPRVDARPIMQPFGDRSGTVIEPMLTDQWFVKMEGLAKRGLELVESGEVKLVPPNWINTYRHWLENIQDWCISRQLWWGHRIPAWYDAAGNVYVGRNEAEVRGRLQGRIAELQRRVLVAAVQGREDSQAAAGKAQLEKVLAELVQDRDVLETWFSSQLWPFSTLGWPDRAAMAKRGFDRHLPGDVLVTGFDIIFFWVARMIMASDSFTGKIPFRDVYITGLIRDAQGQKMSKSKGNVLDPLDIIDGITLEDLLDKRSHGLMQPKLAERIAKATRKEFPAGIIAHGADALRFTLAALASPGRDIKFDLGRAEGYKNFCNKLWNASRFVLMNTRREAPATGAPTNGSPRAGIADPADAALQRLSTPVTDAEKWILARLAATTAEAETHFAAYRFDLLAQCLYEFAWNAFCDWFLELAKPALQGNDAAAADSTRHTLLHVLETLLRLLHPLIPFITEELWRHIAPQLGIADRTISRRPYPQPAEFAGQDYAAAEADVEWFKAMVSALRRVRSELRVSPNRQVKLLLQAGHAGDRVRVERFDAQLRFLLRLESVQWLEVDAQAPAAAAAVIGELKLLVPLAGLVNLDAERARLDREIARVSAEKDKSEAKLGKFTDKVPVAVVEQERQRLADWSAQLAGLRGQRAGL